MAYGVFINFKNMAVTLNHQGYLNTIPLNFVHPITGFLANLVDFDAKEDISVLFKDIKLILREDVRIPPLENSVVPIFAITRQDNPILSGKVKSMEKLFQKKGIFVPPATVAFGNESATRDNESRGLRTGSLQRHVPRFIN